VVKGSFAVWPDDAVTFLAQPATLKPGPPEEGEALREQPGAGFNKFLAVRKSYFDQLSSF